MQYDYLIFDADHTVIDFDADERRAFRAAFAAAGIPADERAVEDCWAFSARNWAALGLTEVHLDSLRARYHTLYHTHVRDIMHYADTMYGFGMGRAAAEKAFSEALAQPAHLVEEASETLPVLAQRYRLCIATNGLLAMQTGRLSHIRPMFDHVFISEEMGCIKPDPAFFCAMLRTLGAAKERCLMIGDSLSSDIAGALGAGMDCIWLNRRGEALPAHMHVKAVIRRLSQLTELL